MRSQPRSNILPPQTFLFRLLEARGIQTKNCTKTVDGGGGGGGGGKKRKKNRAEKSKWEYIYIYTHINVSFIWWVGRDALTRQIK